MAYHLIQLNQIRDVDLGCIHFQPRVETLYVEKRSHNKDISGFVLIGVPDITNCHNKQLDNPYQSCRSWYIMKGRRRGRRRLLDMQMVMVNVMMVVVWMLCMLRSL